ncbi:PAS domain-containing sensor histidine kinase [Arhodomonas sp. KWT2]|uniref:sensor histidine kinase n=2 Tax=unclassified Arhodomonas TaxID=2621637 RepID=UPI0035C18319
MTTTPPQNANGRAALTWRPLLIFSAYRVVVAILLLAGIALGGNAGVFSALQPGRFTAVSLLYVAAGTLFLIVAWRRVEPFVVQVVAGVLIDVVAIALLSSALGSSETAIGVLLITAVAGGSLLTGLRLGAFFAAAATIALLVVQTLARIAGHAETDGYTQVALLGIAIFVTSSAAALLARRARESEALAAERGLDVANLEALNAHIVQRLDTGVIALDRDGRIRLANRLAAGIIGSLDGETPTLAERAPALQRAFEAGGNTERTPITVSGIDYLPRFVPVGDSQRGGTLLFLEDLTAVRAQIQQAKLASMGRLTASIAHEIRNPLSAIMQATQLLGEADYLQDGDRRLVGIITKQSRRLNETVENVLQLSRRSPAQRETVDLAEWVPQVVSEWRAAFSGGEVEVQATAIAALFDRSHMRQVLENLLRNAMDHAGEHPAVTVVTGRDERGAPYLEVRDNGPGIDAEIRDHLFEPFATSRRGGTGLGLYLSRELCEANSARIELRPEETGTCFRVTFAAPDGAQQGGQA